MCSGNSRIFERGFQFSIGKQDHVVLDSYISYLLAIGGGCGRVMCQRRKLLVFLALKLLISSVFFIVAN